MNPIRLSLSLASLLAASLLAACSDGQQSSSAAAEPSQTQSSSTPAASSTPTEKPPVATPQLDSIAVLGHSGATGTQSDPKDPMRDAGENSWATGTNPQVDSIYRRLLADHPAMKGHNYNEAMNGVAVDALDLELDQLLDDAEVLPDVILIQMIDNDMQCDGTDASNYRPFGRTLDHSLTRMEKAIPHVQFFIVSQWATVANWAEWASHHEEQVSANSGTGPCSVFDNKGRLRPEGVRSMQHIVDSYWEQVETVCAKHPGCFTDGAAEKSFRVTDKDVALDLNHLSIAGHHKFAAIAWAALPDAIKNRR